MSPRCSTADGHPRPNSSNKGGDVTAPVSCTICQHKGLSNSGCLFQLINVGSFSKILSIPSANFVNFPFQWKWSVLRIFTLKPPTGTFTMYFKGIKGFMRSHYHWYLSSYSIMSKPFFFSVAKITFFDSTAKSTADAQSCSRGSFKFLQDSLIICFLSKSPL